MKSPDHMRVITSLLMGDHVRKYRKKSTLKQDVSIKKGLRKGIEEVPDSGEKEDVKTFLTRDDNSRANPGKQNCLTVEGKKIQTRVLTDYMYVLHIEVHV